MSPAIIPRANNPNIIYKAVIGNTESMMNVLSPIVAINATNKLPNPTTL